jgi:hypothetical protein
MPLAFSTPAAMFTPSRLTAAQAYTFYNYRLRQKIIFRAQLSG